MIKDDEKGISMDSRMMGWFMMRLAVGGRKPQELAMNSNHEESTNGGFTNYHGFFHGNIASH